MAAPTGPQEADISAPALSRSRATSLLVALTVAASTAAAAPWAAAAAAVPLDLETATAAQLTRLMVSGTSTSVEITRAYVERIRELSVDGPALNAVQLVNPAALEEAAAADARRRAGATGPLLGIPVLLKDNIDVKGLPNTAGSLALAGNVAVADAPLVTSLRAAGAVVLGKTKLTEFANFLTNGMPSGYSSLGGQVLNAYDVSQTPSGSSAGSGVAASVGLAPLTVGTETSGSILSPSVANSLVGVKPTVGLVSRTGIIPIAASQDTAGPMVKTVADAAVLLNGLSATDPSDSATAGNPLAGHDFLADLSTTALQGARIAVVAGQEQTATATATSGGGTVSTPADTTVLYRNAIATLRAQGAVVTEGVALAPAPPSATPTAGTASTLHYEFKRDLNAYLATRTAPTFPVKTLRDVIAFNDAHARQTLKFGQTNALIAERTDTERDAAAAAVLRARELAESKGRLDATLANRTPNDPSDDYTALLYVGSGGAGIGARAGYPTVVVPAGYTSGQGATEAGGDASGNRRPFGIAFLGKAYQEPLLLGLASDYEAASMLRRAPSELNPSLFRCTGLAGSDQTGCTSTEVEPADPALALRISPASTLVRRGSVVQLSVRLVGSDGAAVSGARVGLYTRARGATAFRLSRTLVTGTDGLAFATFRPGDDFRWYADHVAGAGTTAVRSAPGLVQVRR